MLALGAGVPATIVVFCLLALTAVRMPAVSVAMPGSTVSRRERRLPGGLGPRGMASIGFGLPAVSAVDGVAEYPVAQVLVVAVPGGLVLHGAGAPAAVHAHAQATTKLDP